MPIDPTFLTPAHVWRKYDAMEARLTAAVSERMLDLAGLQPGMRVLDLATGRGEPALRAAHRVGRRGLVVGVELSGPLLELAWDRAARDGLGNIDLRVGDAERLNGIPEAHFHAATARWGLMYMTSPVAALECTRRALLPGGALVAALWAEPERVPYYTLPRQLLERFTAVPPIDPSQPGTFRYAEPARIRDDLGRAGFELTYVEELDVPVVEAQDPAEIIEWVRALGLARLLSQLPEADQRTWEADLVAELERRRSDGLVRLGGVTRLVVAEPRA